VLVVLTFACLAGGGCRHVERTARSRLPDDEGHAMSHVTYPPGGRTVLELRDGEGLLLTDAVRVNGRSVGWFILDTGANFTFLDRAAARTMTEELGPRWDAWRDVESDVDGFYRIESLRVGGVLIENHMIGVADLGSVTRRYPIPIAGVIGADVWGACPFSIDFRARRLVLYDPATFQPPRGGYRERLIIDNRIRLGGPWRDANPLAAHVHVTAEVNGVRTRALIDTAADVYVVLEPGLVRRHPDWLSGHVVAQAAGVAGVRGTDGLSLYHAAIERLEVFGVEGAVPDALAMTEGEGGDGIIIGARMLAGTRLTFDYATRRLWID
jgi:hypothetical protein